MTGSEPDGDAGAARLEVVGDTATARTKKKGSEKGENEGNVEGRQVDATGEEEEEEIIDTSFQLEFGDAQFQDVLSKDWDSLNDFDPTGTAVKKTLAVDDNADADQKEDDSDNETDAEGNVSVSDGEKEGEDGEEEATPVKKRTRRRKTKATDGEGDGDEEDGKAKKGAKKTAGTKTKTTTKRKTTTSKKKKKAEKDDDEDDEIAEAYWYFVQVKPGCENMVATSVRNVATALESDDIIDVFVPTTDVTRLTKSGSAVTKSERYFPGYLLVLMAMNRISYGHIVRITHVQSFMGDANLDKSKSGPFRAPAPLKDSEMKAVFDQLRSPAPDSAAAGQACDFALGDDVRVLTGTMQGNTGRVVALNAEIGLVRVSLDIFGVDTTIELTPAQVEKFNAEEEERAAEEARLAAVEEDQRRESSMKQSTRKKRLKKQQSRARVAGMLERTDVKQADVASAADDLAALLADDDNDDWDPLAATPGASLGDLLSDDADGSTGFDNDGFAAADVQTDDSGAGTRSTDELDLFVGDENIEDRKQPRKQQRAADLDARNKARPQSRGQNDPADSDTDDLFAWLDEPRAPRRSKKNAPKSADKQLDRLLLDTDAAGGVDDLWDAKPELGEDEGDALLDLDFGAGDDDVTAAARPSSESDEALLRRLRRQSRSDEEGENEKEAFEDDDDITRDINKFLGDKENAEFASLLKDDDDEEEGEEENNAKRRRQRSAAAERFDEEYDDAMFSKKSGTTSPAKDDDDDKDEADGGDDAENMDADFDLLQDDVNMFDDLVEEVSEKKGSYLSASEEEAFMSAQAPANLAEDPYQLEPVAELEGEDNDPRIDIIRDRGPNVPDFEALVRRDQAKKKAASKKKSTSRKKPTQQQQQQWTPPDDSVVELF